MSSRLLAPGIALAAVLMDAGGIHGLAFWLVLLALPAAAAASFVDLSDVLAGHGRWLRASTSTFAVVLLVAGSAVRESAPRGGSVPVLAVSTVVMALLCYALPAFAWVLEPLKSVRTARPTPRASRA
jgi:hypothetical protein